MIGKFFINIARTPGKGTAVIESIGRIAERLDQSNFVVLLFSQDGGKTPNYSRVVSVDTLRGFAIFDTQEELVQFGRVQFPALFPSPAEPAVEKAADAVIAAVDAVEAPAV